MKRGLRVFFPTNVNYNKETKGYTQDYQPAET